MAETVHDELLRLSDELDRREMYGAAQAMVRGARQIHELETRGKMAETCHGCHQPLEPLAQVRTYHSGCDPQGRAEMLEKALLDVAARAAFEQAQPSGMHMTAFSLIEKAASAALDYQPAHMKRREE